MIWMRRGDCPAVFSLEILWRNPCTGEESAPRETGQGIRQIFKQTGAAFCSHNTSAPQNGIFIQEIFKNQSPARGRKLNPHLDCIAAIKIEFKNQNPARGRKQNLQQVVQHTACYLRTRTPQGDGNCAALCSIQRQHRRNLRTRTPQGDGNKPSFS